MSKNEFEALTVYWGMRQEGVSHGSAIAYVIEMNYGHEVVAWLIKKLGVK